MPKFVSKILHLHCSHCIGILAIVTGVVVEQSFRALLKTLAPPPNPGAALLIHLARGCIVDVSCI